MKEITVHLHEKDYYPITVSDVESGTSSYEGGGSIFSAVVGIIAEALDDKYMKDKWDRLPDEDREHIAKNIELAFLRSKDEVKYLLEKFYQPL